MVLHFLLFQPTAAEKMGFKVLPLIENKIYCHFNQNRDNPCGNFFLDHLIAIQKRLHTDFCLKFYLYTENIRSYPGPFVYDVLNGNSYRSY